MAGAAAPEPPGLESQRKEIEAFLQQCELRVGDSWYLLDKRWYDQWREYVEMGDQNSSSFPGEIDNSDLFEDLEYCHIKETLLENEDFILIPAEAWHKLLAWYNMVPDQPALERKVVELPSTVKVEVYPVEIFLCLHSDMENVLTYQFSRVDTVSTIEKAMRKLLEVPDSAETRLWMKSSDNTCERLRNLHMTVLDSCLSTGMTVIMEMRNEDGTWPSTRPHIMRNSQNDQDSYQGQPGVCGLTNLGNTCFMNSALQCLSNIPPLTEYFLHNAYLDELNFTNPLGMKGEIAEAYADVIKQMWSGWHYTVVPRIFKTKVGHFASQFLGYQQHDSQELLSFLLDGLHEDLNRVKNKEYIELRDADGRPDKEVAEEAWRNHRRRNDSVIVDTFHGLFKSTLVCPECHKISITFDPFCYLSVPLPISKERVMEIFFISNDPADKPVQHRLIVPKAGKVSDLCAALSEITAVPANQMIVTDVFNHRFYKIYQAEESLSCILERDDIFVYEVSSGCVQENGDEVVLALYLRERSHYREYSSGSGNFGTSLFGHPLLLSTPRSQCTLEGLYHNILQRLSRYVHHPDPAEELEEEGEADEGEEEELCKTQTNGINDEGENDEDEKAGPSNREEETQEESEANKSHNSTEAKDTKKSCNNEDQLSLSPDSSDEQAAARQQLSEGEEDDEEEEKEEAMPPSPQSIERLPKRKCCPTKRTKHLFTIQSVNSNGTTERSINDCSSAFSFSSQPYVAIDWDLESKKKYYDENEAERFDKHPSMDIPYQQTRVDLQQCIELFTTVETLEEENPWYCPECKKHQLATKKLDLWSLPEVLIIHLKRFAYTKYSREKLDTIVDFPIRGLDFSDYLLRKTGADTEPPSCYDLIAVSNHYGGLRDGHYTSYSKNKDNGQWYYFDDNKVIYAQEDRIVTSAAYLLFYHRQDKIRKPTLPMPTDGSSSPSQVSPKHDEEGSVSYISMETD